MALVALKPGETPTMYTVEVYYKDQRRYPDIRHHLDMHYSVKQWAALAQAMRLDAMFGVERAVAKDPFGKIVRDTAGDHTVGGQ